MQVRTSKVTGEEDYSADRDVQRTLRLVTSAPHFETTESYSSSFRRRASLQTNSFWRTSSKRESPFTSSSWISNRRANSSSMRCFQDFVPVRVQGVFERRETHAVAVGLVHRVKLEAISRIARGSLKFRGAWPTIPLLK